MGVRSDKTLWAITNFLNRTVVEWRWSGTDFPFEELNEYYRSVWVYKEHVLLTNRDVVALAATLAIVVAWLVLIALMIHKTRQGVENASNRRYMRYCYLSLGGLTLAFFAVLLFGFDKRTR